MLRRALVVVAATAALSAPAAGQTADEVIARSVEARGGLERIRAVQTVRMKGTLAMGPMEMPMLVEIRRPASFRSEMTFQAAPVVQAYDGQQAWRLGPGSSRPEALPKEAGAQMAAQADVEGALVDYRAKGHKVELVGREEGEQGSSYRLEVTLKGGETESYLIDAKTWLPVRVDAVRTIAGQRIEGRTVLGDYREVGGWKWPHSLENSVKGREDSQRITFEKIEVNPEIPDSRFRLPAEGAR